MYYPEIMISSAIAILSIYVVYPNFDVLLITSVAEEHRSGRIYILCTFREVWFMFHLCSILMVTLDCQVILFETIVEHCNTICTGAFDGYKNC